MSDKYEALPRKVVGFSSSHERTLAELINDFFHDNADWELESVHYATIGYAYKDLGERDEYSALVVARRAS